MRFEEVYKFDLSHFFPDDLSQRLAFLANVYREIGSLS